MRVLLVAASASVTGGGERHVADLIAELPARGIEVSVACPPVGDLADVCRRSAVRVFPVDLSAGVRLAQLLELKSALREWDPHVVHAHGSRAAAFARTADGRAAKRAVYTLHGIHSDKAETAARRAVLLGTERTLRGRTARFVTVCRAHVESGARLGILDPARTDVVYNGIRPSSPEALDAARGAFRRELGLGAEVPLALAVGRFDRPKDYPAMLAAWAGVRDRVPGAVLLIVGAGALEGRMRERAVALALGDSVRIISPRPELSSAYADADVFVLSSRWEGLPYVVLEAMDAGLPVVATAVDGIPEAIEDGASGVLVPPGSPEALTDALVRVLTLDASERARMGAAGRATVAERFVISGMIDGVVSTYGKVTA